MLQELVTKNIKKIALFVQIRHLWTNQKMNI